MTAMVPLGGGARSTVLVVDDAPEAIDAIVAVLEPHYGVLTAATGLDALAIAAGADAPDLMLLDVHLPDMDGFEVLDALRLQVARSAVPVILVTAYGSAHDEEQGLACGAVDYITKPYRASTVLARVRTQLELKRARDLLARHNLDLEAEVARRTAENEAIKDVSIRALALVTEARDLETGNHLERTSGYVRALALELRRRQPRYADVLDDRAVDLMARSAPLHDIGKVGIPDAILLKPGRLDADERRIMETHAALGAGAIARATAENEGAADFLGYALQIARHHHERWDGTGYPDRLAGEAIPLPARLMAVADVFDALVSRRVYKPALPPTQAYEIIVAARGSHFDPDLVDAFVGIFDDLCELARRLADDDETLAARAALASDASGRR